MPSGKYVSRTRTGMRVMLAALAIIIAFCAVRTLYRREMAAGAEAAAAERAIELLEISARDDGRIARILENRSAYPRDMLTSLARNGELIDFVMGYPSAEHVSTGGFTEAELGADNTLLMQWDPRWGYTDYGTGVLGMNGCGPTCLSMVVLELTGNAEATPDEVARYAEREGYCVPGNGTKWSLLYEGCAEYGIEAEEVIACEASMKQALSDGRPIVCCMGPGDFTSSGHFIVIYGFDGDGFLVNDPNSMARSGKSWSYERISDQIRGMWSFGT